MKSYNIGIWLGNYLKYSLIHKQTNNQLIHVIFLFVDHFELAGKTPRLSEWISRYPKLASNHKDADGTPPKHTWFYALDIMQEHELHPMAQLVEKGFGEIELHLHHHHDSSKGLVEKLHNSLPVLQKYGFMRPLQNNKLASFGFIHGNWSLNNSMGNAYCGVDNEIELLIDAGCYGDFTFPALFTAAQPAMVNQIYYAQDNGRPKSYNTGRISQVGVPATDSELMIFQGPLCINLWDWRFKWHPTFEDGNIYSDSHASPKRIDAWVRQHIHVKGREEWVFVKVFCHGGQDYKAVLGQATDDMFSYLENKYNDGKRFMLHYVTAREAYNIVKAAEDGKTGNPNQYRDYILPRPF